jgi:hypothetical protein
LTETSKESSVIENCIMLKSKTLEKRHKYRELIEQTTEEEFVIAERIFKEIYKLFKISKSSIRWGGYLYQRELKYVFVRMSLCV